MQSQNRCFCNSGRKYSECCGAIIAGNAIAHTAEALMRSRYTAYVIKDIGYLRKTWHLSTRPANIDPATIPDWHKLDIIHTEAGKKDDSHGIVEFAATALSNQKIHRLHEVSRFTKKDKQWLYLDGDIKDDPQSVVKVAKVGRNDPCPCKSGKKYKKCCGL